MQDYTQPQPTKHHAMRTRILLGFVSIIAVALVAVLTTSILSRVIPSKQTNQSVTKTPQELQREAAKQTLNAASKQEATGDTAAALALYRDALAQYQKAGDKGGEESVKLQIQYLESVQSGTSYTAPEGDTATDPRAADSYTTAVPSNTP